MPEGAGAGNADPNTSGAGSPPSGTGAGTAGSQTGAGNEKTTFTKAEVGEMVQSAIDGTTGRWAKKYEKLESRITELTGELEKAKGKTGGEGEGGNDGQRLTLKTLEANLGVAGEKLKAAEAKAGHRGEALKRLGLVAELEAAKAVYPSQVAELVAAQVALDENDKLFVPDADGDPVIDTSTGKPKTIAALVAEVKAKYPRLFLDSTAGGGGYEGAGGSPATIDAQIAEAESKGDFTLAGRLKAQKLQGMSPAK